MPSKRDLSLLAAEQKSLPPAHLHASDLRGLARLSIDGVGGVTGMVESLHGAIAAKIIPSSKPATERTRGISRLVYRSIHGITGMTGSVLDQALLVASSMTGKLIGQRGSSRQRETMLAALNGVLGDHLHDTNNPLAIQTALRQHGQALNIDSQSELLACMQRSGHQPGANIILFVHGLCMHDLHWTSVPNNQAESDAQLPPAEQLAEGLGWTPVYLHYNSGRHISSNGRELAERLNTLLSNWPVPVTALTIVGHSMGGLVARSACHYAVLEQHDWLEKLQHMVFLGTPHHGAPLERGGNQLDRLLNSSPYSAPFARLGQIRSAGITDLRHGNLQDEDWLRRNRFASADDHRLPLPLPAGVACHAVAATISKASAQRKRPLSGDGLIPVASALGDHQNPAMSLNIAEQDRFISYSCSHLELLHNAKVWQQLAVWLG